MNLEQQAMKLVLQHEERRQHELDWEAQHSSHWHHVHRSLKAHHGEEQDVGLKVPTHTYGLGLGEHHRHTVPQPTFLPRGQTAVLGV